MHGTRGIDNPSASSRGGAGIRFQLLHPVLEASCCAATFDAEGAINDFSGDEPSGINDVVARASALLEVASELMQTLELLVLRIGHRCGV